MASRRRTLTLFSMITASLPGCLDNDSVTPRLYAVDITNETGESRSVALRGYDGDEIVYERTATVQADFRQQFAVPVDEQATDTVELIVENRSDSLTVELAEYATADAPCVHPIFEIYGSGGLMSDTKAYTDCDGRPVPSPTKDRYHTPI